MPDPEIAATPSLFDQIDDTTPEPVESAVPAPGGGEPVQPAQPAEPAAPATPETPAAAAAPPATPPAEPERTVPLAALIATRREADEKVKAAEARVAAAEEKLKKAAEPAPPADPDFLEDPKGYTDRKVESALAELAKVREEGAKELAAGRLELESIRLTQAIETAETAVAEKIPDYREALGHCRAVRYEQLKLANPEVPDEQIVAFIGREEVMLAARELSAGRNPYEYVYKVAKTVGYQPKTPPAPPGGNGATPPAAGAKGGKPPAVPPETTLAGGGGVPPGDDAAAGDSDDDPNAIFRDAVSERFGRRRA